MSQAERVVAQLRPNPRPLRDLTLDPNPSVLTYVTQAERVVAQLSEKMADPSKLLPSQA